MIIDASALLALFFNENHESFVRNKLEENRHSLLMSTVNLAETLILIRDRRPLSYPEIRGEVFSSNIRFVPPTPEQAERAALARFEYPSLNFGDCFAYALAKEEDSPILTLDADFKQTDARIILPG